MHFSSWIYEQYQYFSQDNVSFLSVIQDASFLINSRQPSEGMMEGRNLEALCISSGRGTKSHTPSDDPYQLTGLI